MLAEGIFCISIYLLAGGSLYGKICLELQQLKIIKIVERIYIWAPFDSDFWQCYFSPFSDMWGYWESLAPKKGFAAPVLIPATFGAGFICRYQSSAEGGISSSLFCSGGNRGLEQQKKGNFFFFFCLLTTSTTDYKVFTPSILSSYVKVLWDHYWGIPVIPSQVLGFIVQLHTLFSALQSRCRRDHVSPQRIVSILV